MCAFGTVDELDSDRRVGHVEGDIEGRLDVSYNA